jgi:predicted anti-sigma-YlaC factor YlaD
MKTCREVEELMSLALDDMASEEDRRELDVHLAGCEPCTMVWNAMSQASAMMYASPKVAAPAGFTRSVMGELEARQLRERQRRQGIATVVSLLALLTTVGLLISIWAGVWWVDAVGFRLAVGSFFEQTADAISLLVRGMQVPLGLLGSTQVGIGAVSLTLIVGACAILWAAVLVRVDRNARRAYGNQLNYGTVSVPR